MAQMIQQECVRKKHITTTKYMLTSYKNLSQTIYIIHHHTYVQKDIGWCNGQKDHVVSPPQTIKSTKDQDMIEVTGATGNRYMINEDDFTIPNFFRLMAQMIQQECTKETKTSEAIDRVRFFP